MRIRKLSALLLSLAMLLGLLAGCGGGDEAEITAEDFYGCWEYADYDMWVCFYDDGTFEWYSDGLDSTGTYSMDGVELHLDDDSERFFVTDGEGGLMDWDGDALFASELPDTWGDEDGLGAPDYEPEVNAEDFYGVWEYANQDVWLYIQGDGSYEWISEYSSFGAGYYMDGVELYLDGLGLTVSLDGEGNLIDSDGEVLFQSELPDFYYEWDDEEDYSPTVTAEDFYGCWEYWDYDIWLYVYGDGTYEMYNEDGDCTAGSYTPEGTEIVLDSGERFALDGDGGLIDGEGDGLFASELPDFTPAYYFDEYEIDIDYTLGQGDVTLEDGAYYYEMNTDGNHYSNAPLICSVDLESNEDLGSGYVQRTLSFYRGFSEENIPTLAYGATMGSSFLFYDYYTGFLLPDNDYFADGDGSYYYEFDTPEGLVELAISVSSDWRDDVEGYHYIRVDTITIAAPDWYDGLVMVFPTQPDTWEESKAINELFSELDDYYPALDLPWDVESALNCLVLW